MSDSSLEHIGVARRSGRYPWGSGERPYQSSEHFYSFYKSLKDAGMSEAQIAKTLDMTTSELRAYRTIAKNEIRAERRSTAIRLRDKGVSNVEIAKRMGLPNESSVRALLDDALAERTDRVTNVANLLKEELKKNPYLDVGEGNGQRLGVSDSTLKTALIMLEAEGYEVYSHKARALGTGLMTNNKTLVPPGVEFKDFMANRDKIGVVGAYIDREAAKKRVIQKPVSVDSSEIMVRYGDEGALRDGVIEVRPGVPYLAIGDANYAQVRVLVDDTHYLKGMVTYSDDLPDGVNIRVNTPKADTGNKLDAMKPIKDDPDNPFKAVTRQTYFTDENGKEHQGAMNLVYSEGEWGEWSKTLSSQMLSKQKPKLIEQQLGIALERKKSEFDVISSLTNDTVKKAMLKDFAESADSDAVTLKAAALPRQASQVILPVPSMKENEIYAPNYKNGEKVVLVRHPHGGIFEIPVLKVNNKNPEAAAILGANAKDAVGINPKVAKQLSGADFDGDTVLVIPDPHNQILTDKPLKALKDFDPHVVYKGYEGMKKLEGDALQNEMGRISNLITDMTIKGAPKEEIAKAVKHSMVVIDAEKHELNYKQSYLDNSIASLKEKYQGGAQKGASTIISKASAVKYVDEYELRKAAQGGPIDISTGALVKVPTGRLKKKLDPVSGIFVDTDKPAKKKSTQMAETNDAYSLSSGTVQENLYAEHANALKNLANAARKLYSETPNAKYHPSAAKTYISEVGGLKEKLARVNENKPLERQAQNIAGAIVRAKVADNPGMTPDERKKVRTIALRDARLMTGASKTVFDVTPREWEAIQAGAVSSNVLEQILMKADSEKIKQYAMPREQTSMSASMISRAKSMAANGYSQAEIASALGVSASTINKALK